MSWDLNPSGVSSKLLYVETDPCGKTVFCPLELAYIIYMGIL